MAISTAKQIIELKSPSLVGDSRIDDMVDLAKLTVSESVFGNKYQYALALVVLHQITLDSQSGGTSTSSGSGVSGGLTSEWEGDLKKDFGNIGASAVKNLGEAFYMTTTFGQEYINLKRSCIITVRSRCV